MAGVAANVEVAYKMAVARRLQKVYVLDFRNDILGVPG